MATTRSPQLLDALREQLEVGLRDAADRDLLLSAHGFSLQPGRTVVAARDVVDRFDRLAVLEAVVFGLRFSARAGGVSRVGVSELLGLRVSEVERLEGFALAALAPVSEVR